MISCNYQPSVYGVNNLGPIRSGRVCPTHLGRMQAAWCTPPYWDYQVNSGQSEPETSQLTRIQLPLLALGDNRGLITPLSQKTIAFNSQDIGANPNFIILHFHLILNISKGCILGKISASSIQAAFISAPWLISRGMRRVWEKVCHHLSEKYLNSEGHIFLFVGTENMP